MAKTMYKIQIGAYKQKSNAQKVVAKLKKAGYDLNYYWGRDSVMQKPYVPYRGSQESAVWVWMKDGSVRELSNASNIVYSLIHGPVHDDNKVYFPADVI